jgi:hypothetical protein
MATLMDRCASFMLEQSARIPVKNRRSLQYVFHPFHIFFFASPVEYSQAEFILARSPSAQVRRPAPRPHPSARRKSAASKRRQQNFTRCISIVYRVCLLRLPARSAACRLPRVSGLAHAASSTFSAQPAAPLSHRGMSNVEFFFFRKQMQCWFIEPAPAAFYLVMARMVLTAVAMRATAAGGRSLT